MKFIINGLRQVLVMISYPSLAVFTGLAVLLTTFLAFLIRKGVIPR